MGPDGGVQTDTSSTCTVRLADGSEQAFERAGVDGGTPVLLLARTSPAFLDVLVRALVKLSMRGETHRYFDRLLEHSPRDRETLRRPDVQALVRRAFVSRPDRAARGMATGLVLLMQDWSRWLEAKGAPVRIMVGEEDTIHDYNMQLAHAGRYGFGVVGPVAGAGAFLLFQRPGLVFEHLRDMAGE